MKCLDAGCWMLVAWMSLLGGVALADAPAAAAPAAVTGDQVLQKVDRAQNRGGPWQATAVLEIREKGMPPSVRELVAYSKDGGRDTSLLFTRPKTEGGKGYLILDQNIWFYDPTAGSWERRTVRDNIAGGMHSSDFQARPYSDFYVPTLEGQEKVGNVNTYRLLLKAKPGVEVASPMMRLWVDPTNFNIMKDAEYTLSGKLYRTSIYSNYTKQFSPVKNDYFWFSKKIHITTVDGSDTLWFTTKVDLHEVEASVFTKAWMERQSR